MVTLSPQQRLEAAKQKAASSLLQLETTIRWLHANPEADDRWGRLDAVAKRFEVSFEYVWKALKAALEFQGTETFGPRDSITLAGTYQWIDDLELWAEFLQSRNAGVHDYFALSEEEYAKIAERFLSEARSVLLRLP
ncbi:MAG: nucleotidyltransferase substrate binding protein [Bacteroidetes bacterium]|nr:nucleotidyltransferase substrate binding protein [Bacteroidota bacterium]MCW5894557.1 nucleotidyltransferase substrate binding protein [Bacteroidota bacterium]